MRVWQGAGPVIPEGWSFDEADGTWWHDNCTSVWPFGEGEEQRNRSGHLMAVLCVDCGACFDLHHRPVGVAA